jgi:GT2 family glycosyltransferase/glycosyltransferase involved in cell wall biosynthesis
VTPPPPGTSDVEVNVVIVTHNSASVLPRCLESLVHGLDGVLGHRIVVVDNASTDETVALAATITPEATVLEVGHNAGYATAINLAVAKLPATPYLLVLNPDIRLGRGCVRALIDAMDRPGVGIAAPRLADDDGRIQFSLRREPTVRRAFAEAVLGGRRASRHGTLGEIVGQPHRYDYEQPVAWATGAALLISRECLEEVGPWDESFFLYSEETDFALRARDLGYLTWYTPSARAVHLGGESNTSPTLWARLTTNRVRLFAKRHGRLRTSLFRSAVMLNEGLRATLGSPTHRAALAALRTERAQPFARAIEGAEAHERPWICFSSVDWWYHNRAHSDVQLMRRIAQSRDVLFINSLGMRMPVPGRSTQSGRRVLRKAKSILRSVRRPLIDTPRFAVVSPVIVPFYGSRRLRAINARLVRLQVRLLARSLRIRLADAAVVVTIPTAWEVVRELNVGRLIFNRSDLHSAFEETDQDYIRELESRLLANADVVLYASHSLMETESGQTGTRAVFLDHGVDVDRFGAPTLAEPVDMADIPRPRIGFFGGIDDYVVDLQLLETVARSIPEASVVLIGDATCSMDQLQAIPNVHWLGFRPYEEIPAYGASFDVALMPWLDNDWIEHSNPIKLKEYLALGIPIVSVDFPEVRHYADVIAIAANPDDFVRLTREALNGREVGTTVSRRARVAGATWDARADELRRLCEEDS